MKLITKDTDYAIRALVFMARQKKIRMSVSLLARELKIPCPFLRKILQILNKKKILKSHKGQGGGFLLAVPADKIFIVDLIKIFQGPINMSECFFKKSLCPDIHTCVLKERIGYIEKYVVSKLSAISIASLVN